MIMRTSMYVRREKDRKNDIDNGNDNWKFIVAELNVIAVSKSPMQSCFSLPQNMHDDESIVW